MVFRKIDEERRGYLIIGGDFNVPLQYDIDTSLSRTIRKEDEVSGIRVNNSDFKLALFADDIILTLTKPESRLKLALKALVTKETLLQVKGSGASGSLKLNKKQLQSKDKAAKKKAPLAAKTKKPAAAAKKAPKSPKKPKKVSAAAKSPKKVKKPAKAALAAKSPKKNKAAKPKKATKSPAKKTAVKPKTAAAKSPAKAKVAKAKKAAPKKK
ncbi:histone H1B-like [Xenopus laevis]|uniref:Histone H1B-like n=1 Tax=Xenopus laevis TaxID=8355 RepID=A0A8J1MPJ1_XENLA|nr:histone H1B-like [Xenopus laevis]